MSRMVECRWEGWAVDGLRWLDGMGWDRKDARRNAQRVEVEVEVVVAVGATADKTGQRCTTSILCYWYMLYSQF